MRSLDKNLMQGSYAWIKSIRDIKDIGVDQ